MSNIEKIKAEIERQRSFIEGLFIEGDNSFYEGQDDAYNHLLAFIDSLPEVKPSRDLEEEVKRYYSDNFTYISSDQPTLSILTNIARHFTEWQKGQMIKDAVEGEIQMRYSGCLCAKTIRAINEDKFKLGDKVKIIIVKED